MRPLTLRRTLQFLLPLLIALFAVAIPMQSVSAWTHLKNNFDSSDTDYICGHYSSVPCLYWPEPNHVSGTVYYRIDSTATNVGPNHYNFTSAISGATGNYNAITGAYNPYLYNCQTSGCIDPVIYSAADLGEPYILGSTNTFYDYGAVQYTHGQYWAYITGADVEFNTLVYWNASLDWYHSGAVYHADARATAAHETGHVEGLGHTGITSAIMHWDLDGFTFYTPQSNDISGIRAVYTGTIPACGSGWCI
jgi:hypothetical protein